jgi:hypothetical protein
VWFVRNWQRALRGLLGRLAELDQNSLFYTEEDIQLRSPLEFFPDAVPVP